VETTFVLPWDLNPNVEPQRLSKDICDKIRIELIDLMCLDHLQSSGSINWNNTVIWQCRPIQGGEWHHLQEPLNNQLEVGYCTCHEELQLDVYPNNRYNVNYPVNKLINIITQEQYELRRLAFTPLAPMKTEIDVCSLFHATSLGLWGIHDRMQLLKEAVVHTLHDQKAQIGLYARWINESSLSADTTQLFALWEAAKKNFVGSPQLHIFTLSNIIQRPIIVYSHPENLVGGLYLPLLWEKAGGVYPCESYPHLRNPLVLGFDCTRNHFVPLITFKGNKGPNPMLLPLTYINGGLLKVHYLSETEAKDPTTLLVKLMFIDTITHYLSQQTPLFQLSYNAIPYAGNFPFSKPVTPHSPGHPPTLACVLNISHLPEVMDQLVKRFQSAFL
jgi:hypothetical protein